MEWPCLCSTIDSGNMDLKYLREHGTMQIRALLAGLSLLVYSVGYATINIGTLMFKPPYILSPGNGFDVDLAQLICKRLKEQCKFVPMGMSALYQKLQDGKVELAIGGIPISYDLKIDFIFSLPYLLSEKQFLILKESPVNSLNDLKGTTVGLLLNKLNGGVSSEYLVKHYGKLFKIKVYNDIEDIMLDLNEQLISAAFLDYASVNYWIQQGGDQFKSLGPVLRVGNGIAILALPKNQALIDRINGALKDIEKDDSYLKLYKTYFTNE